MLIRTEAFRSVVAAGITLGTVGSLAYSSANQGSYTFATGPTVDGGGAKMLMIPVWCTSFGSRTANHSSAVSAFTLNAVSYDSLLFHYLDNTSSDRYVQAAAAIWNSPASGQVVFTLSTSPSITATACGIYYMNLSGLHASPLGVLVQDQFTADTTALAFQATTTAENSLLLAIAGARNESKGPFAFDNGSFVSLGETGGGSTADGSWDVAYRNGLSIGTYDCGGDWTTSDAERIGGGAFELKAA